jgi:hypothetical protein
MEPQNKAGLPAIPEETRVDRETFLADIRESKAETRRLALELHLEVMAALDALEERLKAHKYSE